MANFSFYCRQSKADKNGYAPIELSIIINKKRCFLNLERRENPVNFNKLLKSKKQNDLKEYLDTIRTNINKAITQIAQSGQSLTSEVLREYIRCGGVKLYTITDLYNDYMKLIRIRCEKENIEKYELAIGEFITFVDKDTQIQTITPAQIEEYKYQCLAKYKQSTAYAKVSKVKSLFKFAQDNGKLQSNPFANIKIGKGRANVEYLTEEEVKKIINAELYYDRLKQVRDLFLFQCGSGLSYSDMSHLTKEDIKNDESIVYIIKCRQKTDIEFTAVLLPMAIEVLKRYDYQLPKISNQKLNAYLKEIQMLSGIKKNLHSHLARKTYCTYLLNSGVRMDVVSKCAGHSNTRITASIYAHMMTDTILREVSQAIK